MTEGSKPSDSRLRKSDAAFRTISEVATELDVPQHVLRFWESKFTQVKPLKRGGGRRYYRPEDVALLKRIRYLLYEDGLTIKGVQKLFRDHGVKVVVEGGNQTAPVVHGDDRTTDTSIPVVGDLLSDLKNMRAILNAALTAN